jgi:hypothetical protein
LDGVDVQRLGVSQSYLNPVVLLIILIVGMVILVAGRRKAAIAFLAAAILIPDDQILLIGPAHFPMLRVLALFGLVRLMWAKFSKKQEIFSGGMNGIDKGMIGLTLFSALDGVLLWRDSASIIFQLGEIYTAFGVYFLLRFLVRDEDDVRQMLRVLAGVAVVVAGIMIFEQATGRNPLFAALGGARASFHSTVNMRDDKFRATGCFDHPILAGTFGGITLPLFVGLWWRGKRDRVYAAMGAVSSVVIAFSAGSSTALFGLLGGILALCFWPLRRRMRWIRWGVVGTLVSLHMVMKAPVWQLIARMDLTGGSSSDHRYQLVNQCILHFWDWALVGSKYYGYWGWMMWDLSNQYVAIADPSGLIPLLYFVAIIVYGFKYVGRARRQAAALDKRRQLFIWALGGSLFANVVAFLGISYFDQTIVAWYALLAMIPAAALTVRNDYRKAGKGGPQVVDGDAGSETESARNGGGAQDGNQNDDTKDRDAMGLNPASFRLFAPGGFGVGRLVSRGSAR